MDKIKAIVSRIAPLDAKVMDQAQKKLDLLTKPQGSLGRLEDLAKQLAGIIGALPKNIKDKVVFTFAADHGVTAEGVSAYPSEVTAQMVYNFLAGGAGINVLARHVGARVAVADLGIKTELKIKNEKLKIRKVGSGTKNMAKEPAMTESEAVKSIEAGMEIFEEELAKGLDIAATGEMGIGNTTAASCITAVIAGKDITAVCGRGTGLDDQGLSRKVSAINKAIALNKPDKNNALDVLAKVGGFEIGALAGVILAAAANKKPIVIDGFISGAAALIAFGIEPKCRDYMIAGHVGIEPGHRIILEHLGLKPLLDLDLRLGEGTGAALAIGIIDAAVKILNEMATFESAGVSEKK